MSNSALCIGNSEYKTLVVPYAEYMPHGLMDKIIFAAENGVRVVWIDGRAGAATDGADISALADAGDVCPLGGLAEYFNRHGLWDVSLAEPCKKLKYLRRDDGAERIYMFVSEDISEKLCADVCLDGFCGGEYLVYDPFGNECHSANSADGTVHIEIEPYNSLVIITGAKCSDYPVQRNFEYETAAEFFDYEVSVNQDGEYTPLGTLFSPKNIAGADGIPDFCGKIKYCTDVTIAEDGEYELDFGKVGEAMTLWVNGECAGDRICPPYRFDITPYIKKGHNSIEAVVATTRVYRERDDFSQYMLIEPVGLMSRTRLIRRTESKK